MFKFLTAIALLASTVAAQAASVPQPTKTRDTSVRELLDAAAATCPALSQADAQGRADEPTTIKQSARHAGMTARDTDTLLALCAMYHLGYSDGVTGYLPRH